jgi:hypothetical protein
MTTHRRDPAGILQPYMEYLAALDGMSRPGPLRHCHLQVCPTTAPQAGVEQMRPARRLKL